MQGQHRCITRDANGVRLQCSLHDQDPRSLLQRYYSAHLPARSNLLFTCTCGGQCIVAILTATNSDKEALSRVIRRIDAA